MAILGELTEVLSQMSIGRRFQQQMCICQSCCWSVTVRSPRADNYSLAGTDQ